MQRSRVGAFLWEGQVPRGCAVLGHFSVEGPPPRGFAALQHFSSKQRPRAALPRFTLSV
jgi:hypothetical protein